MLNVLVDWLLWSLLYYKNVDWFCFWCCFEADDPKSITLDDVQKIDQVAATLKGGNISSSTVPLEQGKCFFNFTFISFLSFCFHKNNNYKQIGCQHKIPNI